MGIGLCVEGEMGKRSEACDRNFAEEKRLGVKATSRRKGVFTARNYPGSRGEDQRSSFYV